MSRITFILVTIILTIGCAEKNDPKTTSKIDSAANQPRTLLEEAEEDTILERNDPNSLDLSKHQIFIDTTRNSTFYECRALLKIDYFVPWQFACYFRAYDLSPLFFSYFINI